MKILGQFVIIVALVGASLMAGCVGKDQYDTCVRRNEIQQQRIQELLAGQDDNALRGETCAQELKLFMQKQRYLSEQIDALKASLAQKNAMLGQLTDQLGQIALPVELSNALAEWTLQTGSDLVTFDEKSGIVRFKSDLLFDKGSDVVQADKKELLKQLSSILTSPAAAGFDALIVGHTDDLRMGPATRAKHYSNWHLSAHRAISVKSALTDAGLGETRVAVMGMGEFRPIEANKANKQGNPKNRRVEIYIVPAGQITASTPGE